MNDIVVKFQTGLLDRFLYLVIKTFCFFQRWIGRLFHWLLVNPIFIIGKYVSIEKSDPDSTKQSNNPPIAYILLDSFILSHRILWVYFKFMFNCIGIISGLKPNITMYQQLLNWNEQIPLIGYEIDNATVPMVGLLLDYADDRESRGFDTIWLSMQMRSGKFQILSKKLENNESSSEVIINCVWIEGKNVGGIFTIKKLPDLESKSRSILPTAIYCPPKFVIIIREIILSIGAILIFVQFLNNGWYTLYSFFKNCLKFFQEWLSAFWL